MSLKHFQFVTPLCTGIYLPEIVDVASGHAIGGNWILALVCFAAPHSLGSSVIIRNIYVLLEMMVLKSPMMMNLSSF